MLGVLVVMATWLALPCDGALQDPGEDLGGVDTTAPGFIPNEPAAWILVDADTGAVLDGKEARTPHLPGSTIKLLTSLIAIQRFLPAEPVPVSELRRRHAGPQDEPAGGRALVDARPPVLDADGVGQRRRRRRGRADRERARWRPTRRWPSAPPPTSAWPTPPPTCRTRPGSTTSSPTARAASSRLATSPSSPGRCWPSPS